MEQDLLSLKIAGGILVAATVLLFARIALWCAQRGYPVGAISFGGLSALFWITFVSASLGLADW